MLARPKTGLTVNKINSAPLESQSRYSRALISLFTTRKETFDRPIAGDKHLRNDKEKCENALANMSNIHNIHKDRGLHVQTQLFNNFQFSNPV